MSALSVTMTGKAGKPRPEHGTVGEGNTCERCHTVQGRKPRPSMRMVWLLGRPWYATCVPCTSELLAEWDALATRKERG